MKRALLCLVAALFVFQASQLFAEESEYYYVNVPILKVYAHSEGYKVVYRFGSVYTADAYLPMRWFVSGGKGEFDYGWGSTFPYMTVFFKGGKFSHVRLHLNADKRDARWGIFDQYADVKDKFDGVEEVKLKF